MVILYHTQNKISKTIRNNKGDYEEGAEVDFMVFLGFGGGIHDEAGDEVSEEKSNESEPRVVKCDADGGAE